MSPRAEKIDAVRSELKRIYQSEGQVVFWPSVLRDFGDAETIACILSHLFVEGFLYISVDIHCPQGQCVVVGADVKTKHDFDELFYNYGSRSCQDCSCDGTLGDMNPEECEFEIVYHLADWIRAKKKPAESLSSDVEEVASKSRDLPFDQAVSQSFVYNLSAERMEVNYYMENEVSKNKKEDNKPISIRTRDGNVGDVAGGNMDTDRSVNIEGGGDYIAGDIGGSSKSGNATALGGVAATGFTPETAQEGDKNRLVQVLVAVIGGLALVIAALLGNAHCNSKTAEQPNTRSEKNVHNASSSDKQVDGLSSTPKAPAQTAK
jgi:hypothetical protein